MSDRRFPILVFSVLILARLPMRYLRFGVLLAAGLAVGLGLTRPALAQSAPPAPPTRSTSPTVSPDVQQVRDDLARLKKEFDVLRQQYDERLIALERRLSQIGGGPSVIESPASPESPKSPDLPKGLESPATPAGAAPQAAAPTQVAPGASKVFNPDMSVIANFLGAAGKNPVSTQPSLQLKEAEVALQAVVDPYARADFYLSAGPDGLEIEEGFLTFTGLPGHLLLKVGKMRASFGKVNTLHTHAMPTADRPLVTENLVGGEEGLSDSGLSLAYLIQNPLLFLEVTGEVYRGASSVFQSPQRSKLNYVGRLRAYRDITEGANIDLGTSVAFGPTDVGTPLAAGGPVLDKRLIGFDGTFHYRPLRRAIYHRVNLRSELVWSRQDLPLGLTVNAFGYYGLAEYQFARRWYAGGRFDHSGRALDGTLHDNGGSFFLTYWPSEFSQIRTQVRRTNYAGGVVANEFLFQFNFAIGAHGAHVF
jgi:hypothetical protein